MGGLDLHDFLARPIGQGRLQYRLGERGFVGAGAAQP
jgi:hypothetical protein